MHMQSFFSKYDYFGSNVSENIFEKGLCLPSDTKLTDEDLKKIVRIVRSVFENA